MAYEVPILFIVFNRPDTTGLVFREIRRRKPRRLYVAADGPRAGRAGEAERCAAARAVATAVDWDCELTTLLRPRNLGCRRAVVTALDWFYAREEAGIVLEDDCVPAPGFFEFCESMLTRYAADPRVMLVSGYNALGSWRPETADYHFSRIGGIWGWASWRRAWRLYDGRMRDWPAARASGWLRDLVPGRRVALARTRCYDLVAAGKIDTWDYQWSFTRLFQGGLSVVPAVNLVQNVGFRDDATHTRLYHRAHAETRAGRLRKPYRAPLFPVPDPELDRRLFRSIHPGPARRLWLALHALRRDWRAVLAVFRSGK